MATEAQSASARARVGCCGWSYREWVGPFYRTQARMFAQYARTFDLVEMDSAFYRVPELKTMETLARSAPPGFSFTVKVPQALTHEARLIETLEAAKVRERYLRAVEPLRAAGKLALVLVQLPPSFGFEERGALERFLQGLQDAGFPTATEFRHLSWLSPENESATLGILRSTGSSYTVVDEPLLPPVVHRTASPVYVRLHGRNPALWYDYRYSDGELGSWASTVSGLVRDGTEVIVVFNNHPHGNAPRDALRFMEMAGVRRRTGPPGLSSFDPRSTPG